MYLVDGPVNLNRLAVKIILSALLDNSIKYGPAGQTVTVSCQSNGGQISLTVADQGPGIPEAEQEKIFQAYYRIAEQPAETPGRGLGLHAVRVLARAMSGEITVQSHHGHGSCFRVDLPADATGCNLNAEA